MNAQLLLSPSLFEMDELATSRYNERPNEGVLTVAVNYLRLY